MAPSDITHAQNIKEALRAAPMSYYVLGLITMIFVIPACAARLMDMAIPPYFAVLFLFPVCFNLAQKIGILTFSHDEYPHTPMNIVRLCILLAQLFLVIRRGTKGPNRYGPDPVMDKA